MKFIRHKDAAGRLPEKENRKGSLRGILGLTLLLTLGVVLAAGGPGTRASAMRDIDSSEIKEDCSLVTGQGTGIQNTPSAGSPLTAVYRDSTVYVEASYSEEAKLPGDAELRASLVMPEDDPDAYSQKMAAAMAAMGQDDKTVPTNAIYHVGFYVGDQEVEPAAPVNVAVQILQDGFSAGEPIKVIHLGENDAEVIADTSADDAGLISFTTDGFSDFVFIQGLDGTLDTSNTSNTSGMEGNSIVGTGRSIAGTIRQIAGSIMPNGGAGTSGSGKPMTIGNEIGDGEPTDETGGGEPMAIDNNEPFNLNDLSEGDVTLTFQYWDDESGTWQSIPKEEVPGEEGKNIFEYYNYDKSDISIIFRFNKEFTKEELTESGGMFIYKLPPYLTGFSAGEDNKLYDQNGDEAGTVEVGEDGIVTIRLNDEFLDKNNTAKSLRFTLSGHVDLEKANEENKGTGNYPGFDLHFPEDQDEAHSWYGRLELTKECVSSAPWRDKETDAWYVDYRLTVTALDYSMPDVRVEDVFNLSSDARLEGLIKDYVLYAVKENPEKNPEESEYKQVDKEEKEEPNSVYQTRGEDNVPHLNWYLGNMTKEESRTLYYRVELDQNKMETTDFTSGTNLSNNAEVFSGKKRKDSADEDLPVKMDVGLWKGSEVESGQIKFEPDKEGGGWVAYTVWVQNNSKYPIEVKLYDSVNDPNATTKVCDYCKDKGKGKGLTYDQDSFVFDPQETKAGTDLSKENKENILEFTVEGKDDAPYTSFTAHIGWLEPGEKVTVTYKIHVDAAALAEGEVHVHNGVIALFEQQQAENGTYRDHLQRFQGENTIDQKQWAAKNYGNKVDEPKEIEIPENDKVYDATTIGSVTKITDHERSFHLSEDSFMYTVTVNGNNVWDVSSATMGDHLSNGLHYSGYVKVEAKKKGSDEVLETVWVKVDQLKEFKFTGQQIGFGNYGEGTSYVLTYYTTIDESNKNSQIVLENDFTMTGEIGSDGKMVNVNVQDRTTNTATTSNHLEVRKDAWYYEPGEDNLGAFYWVVKVDASYIPKGFALRDVAGDKQKLQENSLLGVYTGPEKEFSASYQDWNKFEESVETDGFEEYSKEEYSSDYDEDGNGLTVTFIKEHTQNPSSPCVYLFFKTYVTERQSDPYKNSVYSNVDNISESEVNHHEDDATNFLSDVGSVNKAGMLAFDWDGSEITTLEGNNSGTYSIPTTVLTDNKVLAGRYAAWSVSVNETGNMKGDYTIIDDIPEGMELSFVAIANVKNIGNPNVTECTPPWPRCLSSVEDAGEPGLKVGGAFNNSNNYTDENPNKNNWKMKDNWKPWDKSNWRYYLNTDDKTVSWGLHIEDGECNVGDGETHHGDTRYAFEVDYLVVCRVTDDDVLLGVEKDGATEKSFTNRVTVYNGSSKVDEAEANQSVPCKPVVKKDGDQVVTNGQYQQSIKFTLSVNESATMVTGDGVGDTLTLTDTMSPNLSFVQKSVEFFSNKECTEKLEDSKLECRPMGNNVVTFIIPNGKAVYIRYECLINAPDGVETSAENTINFENRQPPDGQDGTWNETVRYDVTASIEGSKTLQITKQDSLNGELLPGAMFDVTLLGTTDAEGAFTESEGNPEKYTLTTNPSGISNEFIPKEGGLYEIVETQAPEGYVPDPTFRYYWIGGGNLKPPVVDDVRKKIEDFPSDAVIQEEYIGTINIIITNERAKITVKKKFVDNDSGYEMGGEGTYTFGLFTKTTNGEYVEVNSENGEQVEGYVRQTLTYPEDKGRELTFYVPYYNTENPVKYYILELDEDGKPMEQGSKSWVQTDTWGKMQFEPSYKYGDNATDEGASNKNAETTVTVTNILYDAYSLPETGGPGTLAYLVTGLALVLGSGLVLTARKRRRQTQ